VSKSLEYRRILSNIPPPSSTFFYYHILGLNYSLIGEYENAENMLKKAIELKPERRDIYFYLASIYCMQNKDKDAFQSAVRAIQYDEKYID